MEECNNKFVDLVNGCGCLGRRKTQEPIELTSRRNTYGQKLAEALENKGGRKAPRGSRPDISKPLPHNPPGRASLDLGKARRQSADLNDMVSGDSEDGSMAHEYDHAWYEMLSSVHNALKHTRYSISGRMGMAVWGCANGAKTGLSIVCPIESREAVKIWCISTSGRFSITQAEPDILTFQSPGSHHSPSRTWRIRIRWMPEYMFEAMPKVEMALRYDDGNPYAGEQVAEVNVLTLPALLNNCASAWVDHSRKQHASGSRLKGIEEDIFSILERIVDLSFAEEGAGPLTEAECRIITGNAFWLPFTQKHPDSPAMFALCGLPMPQPPTTVQPAPNATMDYAFPGRFSNPRPAPPVPPKDKGRDLTSNVKRRPEPQPQPQKPVRGISFMDLFSPTVRQEAKAAQAERERRQSEDARKLREEVRRGARKMDERENERRRQHKKRDSSKEAPSTRHHHHHHRNSKAGSSRSSSSRRHHSTPSAGAPDGTKVSNFDPSAVDSGKGRIPRRGHFADLFIEDDGETL
ncbi:hypothetical protein N8I77_012023 [Diaporthe amygdali]|uniref:Uncharacterized protein n=1 Tax=Phomopsis amygdali TaxID=1214568 RepID=A0AAD9S3Y0_PHOAM|nr:hypothetical protein N8I77_012023 [Diaporthe amygdali]